MKISISFNLNSDQTHDEVNHQTEAILTDLINRVKSRSYSNAGYACTIYTELGNPIGKLSMDVE